MTDRIQKIVAELPELEDVTGVWRTADRCLAQGDNVFLADLSLALTAAHRSGDGWIWQYESLFDHLLRSLAVTPGPGNVAQALRLISPAGATAAAVRERSRYVASLLASCQSAEDLSVVFTGKAPEELRACLVHELVLRGVDVTRAPGIAGWATSPHWKHHPLGELPLTLSGVEGEPDLPGYSARGGSHAMPYGPSRTRRVRAAAAAHAPSAADTTTPAAADRIGAAVANWVEGSNGRVEARVFGLAAPLGAEAVPGALPSLGLECLCGAGKKTAVTVAACPPDQAWRVLFAAASTGGAYNHGVRGAYGRLAAWRSLAGLSGAAETGPAEEVEARVRECAWYDFDAETSWFERVAWDIGLLAVSPGRRRLAVLAATDTD
ncbi:DUF6183 family protein [Streptomyces longispororuber]|uniref:DUF6183 family protein n=1 Tax=Streptomyces longispororuber TaxID=68230 RepID=UPI00167CB24F|nr:DUF6183 family protein [Streptomyces longispororuber]